MIDSQDAADPHRLTARRLSTLANVSAAVWFTDADGMVSTDNPGWQAFTGQSRQACSGWGWLDAIHPDDRAHLSEAWRAAVAAQEPAVLSYRLRRHDGQYRDIAAQCSPLLDEGGRLREWIGLCIDVTDTRRVETALRESEERLRFLDALGQSTRELTDAAAVMTLTAQLLGEYLQVTRCAYADVDADNDRFTIRNDWSVPGVTSSAGVYSLALFGPQANALLHDGRTLVVNDVDGELGDDGGGRMFKSIGIRAIICAPLVKQGRLVAMMAVHQSVPRHWGPRDISLVGEVVERCWAHIERVRDAAMLHEQDRLKDEFLATLAHELRNPLAPIRYATAMLRRSTDGASGARARDMIDRQVGHMARLIDDLLDLSRINRGLIDLQRERVNLQALLQQAVEASLPAIEAASHRFELDLPPEPLPVEADPARIVQVIGNLLNNAAKYTPDGGRIRLAAWRDGARVLIEVTDNGIGIPPEQQGRLFQMFTQLPHSTARAKGGLGIGLALVKTLVRLHGGRVSVRSQGLDEGTTFQVELPGAAHVTADEAPAGSALAGVGRVEPRAMPVRVLVVEDNPDGLEALLALLELMGYEAVGARDGTDGLAEAARCLPHIVLLDLGLPGMDGCEVARRLRAAPQHADTVIVALTGWGALRDRAQTAEAGFDGHLTKPVDPVWLETYLAGLLGARMAELPRPAPVQKGLFGEA